MIRPGSVSCGWGATARPRRGGRSWDAWCAASRAEWPATASRPSPRHRGSGTVAKACRASRAAAAPGELRTGVREGGFGAPGGTRTHDLQVRNANRALPWRPSGYPRVPSRTRAGRSWCLIIPSRTASSLGIRDRSVIDPRAGAGACDGPSRSARPTTPARGGGQPLGARQTRRASARVEGCRCSRPRGRPATDVDTSCPKFAAGATVSNLQSHCGRASLAGDRRDRPQVGPRWLVH
jgi:hypothetical protein